MWLINRLKNPSTLNLSYLSKNPIVVIFDLATPHITWILVINFVPLNKSYNDTLLFMPIRLVLEK